MVGCGERGCHATSDVTAKQRTEGGEGTDKTNALRDLSGGTGSVRVRRHHVADPAPPPTLIDSTRSAPEALLEML